MTRQWQWLDLPSITRGQTRSGGLLTKDVQGVAGSITGHLELLANPYSLDDSALFASPGGQGGGPCGASTHVKDHAGRGFCPAFRLSQVA